MTKITDFFTKDKDTSSKIATKKPTAEKKEKEQEEKTKIKKTTQSPRKMGLGKKPKKIVRKETEDEVNEKELSELEIIADSVESKQEDQDKDFSFGSNDDEGNAANTNQDNSDTEVENDQDNSTQAGYYDDIQDYITDAGWRDCLSKEFQLSYFKNLVKKLNERHGKEPIYPPKEEIFSALNYTHFDNVKVVIVGQDPYHGPGQAHGLSFSVKMGVAPPPSLKNMYKELSTDIEGFVPPKHGFLEKWANQGVFLLNAALTVEQSNPNSHKDFGWYTFTDAILKKLNESKSPIVFLLWGGFAQKKGAKLDTKKHLVLKSGHPSPLSIKHFEGCKHFSKANEFLVSKGIDPVDWTL
ncbi:hypothetical protein CYY_001971 [Polysphondylium violaceum]|uniref:Uracil-DNA glycosylase n=1 Tax=Polysphondylium violaceum TaxID=133409 RepID=A0A8J4Q0U6_9MYCE|nr:hypothetical protein CYY_001971 [Polysphondylium violaceum]